MPRVVDAAAFLAGAVAAAVAVYQVGRRVFYQP